jgi:hypothetical protein
MASDHLTPDGWIVPSPRPAKVIGILNIIFALIAMGMGLCCSVYTLVMPSMGPMIKAQQQQALAQQAAIRRAALASLHAQEQAAETEEAKAQIRAKIGALEAAPLQVQPEIDIERLGLQDPRYLGHFGADLASNLILNLLMFLAGIGLIRLKEWGRTLGVWVAALKLVRLLALTASLIFMVVPFVTRRVGEFGAQVEAQEAARKGQPAAGPPGPPSREIAEMLRALAGMATGYAVGLLIFGSIYPAISLVVLTRPGVKAACLPEEPS